MRLIEHPHSARLHAEVYHRSDSIEKIRVYFVVISITRYRKTLLEEFFPALHNS